MNINWNIDHYATLGIDSSADKKRITIAYRKASNRFHPDKFPTIKNGQGCTAGTECGKEISKEEGYQFCSNKCRFIYENCCARFKILTCVNDVLIDESLREQYDNRVRNNDRIKCCGIDRTGMLCTKDRLRSNMVKSSESHHLFCSKECADNFDKENYFIPGKIEKPTPKSKSVPKPTPHTPPKPTPKTKPTSPKSGSKPKVKKCCFCGDPYGPFGKFGVTDGSAFCAQECANKYKSSSFGDRKNKDKQDKNREGYRDTLRDLDGWSLLSGEEKKEFLRQVDSCSNSSFKMDILPKVKALIATKKANRPRSSGPTPTPSGPTPTPSGPTPTPSGPTPTPSGPTPTANIETSSLINLIKEMLDEEPRIENSELSIPDWENKINQSSEINDVERIKDQILADIDVKRRTKLIGSELDQLISQAWEAVEDNDLALLSELLVEIKNYQNTDIYPSKKAFIDELEKKLAVSDPVQNKEITIESLNNILEQDPPVDISELNEKNRDFAKKIKDAATPEQVKEIEEEVLDDINGSRTNKVVDNLLIIASKVNKNNAEELSEVRQKIMALVNSNNKYEKVAWEKNKQKFESFLLEWSGKQSHPQQSSKSLLIGLTVAALVVAVIAGLLIIRQKSRRRR